jgi:cephalosporin-C deacetylase-like acetyl esterase
MPAKTPLNARITGSFERDTYKVEKIVFQSMPGLYVTGNLYLPKENRGRHPAVLYLCGHSPGPWGNKVDYQHHGIWLARHGYVAFLIDSVEFGELPGIHHGTHDLEMWDWLSIGYTPVAPEVWNSIRAVDYLETRSEVDTAKIAVTGISGGGAMTWYSAAVDERLRVAAPVCSNWTVESQTADDAVHHNCDCIYFINTFRADLSMVGALIAPRPLKIISARRDVAFPTPGFRDVYQRIRPIYELYGAADKIAEYDHDAPHADIVPFRKEANEWINRWIKNDTAPFVEGDIQREQPSTLKVLDHYPPDAINGHIQKVFVPTARPVAPVSLSAWNKRRASLLAEIKDKSLRAPPAGKVPFNAVKTPTKDWSTRYSGSVVRVEFETEQGLRVNGQLFVPSDGKPKHPALIYAKGSRDVVYPIDYDSLLGVLGTHVVLVLHPRAVDYPIDTYKTATIRRTAVLLGETLEAMQTRDIVRSIDFLREGEGLELSSVSIYARKEMAVPALYAAATDERISRVILDDPPYSHWQGPAMLNALRFTDLPEVAALVAPREIVSLGPLPADYRLTSAVYALYGNKAGIRSANALPDALRVWEIK